MGNEYVDDDPFALYKRAEEDVANINALINDKDVPEEYNYISICFHATQAVEKFMKGFIVENNGMVKKTHNLDYVQSIAENVNKNFSIIRKECLFLNEYTPSARYSDNQEIEKDEINNVLKSLKAIYHFEPIVKMREIYTKRDGYRILPEFDFLKRD